MSDDVVNHPNRPKGIIPGWEGLITGERIEYGF